ncbi:unnamed protein product [Parajaminaea phylloscopi]
MPSWNPTRTRVQLKLAVERTKMLQEKKEAIAKKERKEIAALVEKGKEETARIKTEGMIAEDIHIELLEILELYCETVLARFALLDLPGRDPEPSLVEPVAAIIHCAPRVELRELHILRDMLAARYSREWVQTAIDNKDNVVGSRVSSRLKIFTPAPDLIDLYVAEVCRAYDVPFSSPHLDKKSEEAVPPPAQPAGEKDGASQSTSTTSASGTAMPPPAQIPQLDAKAAPATHSDASVSQATGNVVKSDGEPDKTLSSKEKERKEYDDLEARFAALKKK